MARTRSSGWPRWIAVVGCATLFAALCAHAEEGRQGWPQFAGGASHDNRSAERNAIHYPQVRWHLADARGQPTLGHGALYSGGPALQRVDPDTGAVLATWKPEGGRSLRVAAAPALHRGHVIALLSDGRVVALRPDLSEVLWSRAAPAGVGSARAPGALDGDTYVFAAQDRIVALDALTGAVRWSRTLDGSTSMSPAIHGGCVFLGTKTGCFLAVRLEDGTDVWEYQGAAGFEVTDPVVAFGKVFIADRGIRGRRLGALNAFDEQTGKLLWSTVFVATGFSTPGIHERCIVGGFGTRVACFDPDTGERRAEPLIRTGRNAFGSPTIVGDTLYFGNLDGRLYACDARSGEARWTFSLPMGALREGNEITIRNGGQVYDFVYLAGRLYVSTSRGLYALQQDPEHEEAAPAGFVLMADS